MADHDVIITGNPERGTSFPWGTVGPNQKKKFRLNDRQLEQLHQSVTKLTRYPVSYQVEAPVKAEAPAPAPVVPEVAPEVAPVTDPLAHLFLSVGQPLEGDPLDEGNRGALVQVYTAVTGNKAGKKHSKTLLKEIRNVIGSTT